MCIRDRTELDDGTLLPVIMAAPNLATAFGSDNSAYTGNGAGLFAFTIPGLDMVDVTIDAITPDLGNCDLATDEPEPYETNGFVGYVLVLENCGGHNNNIVYVGAQIPGEDRFILLGVQVVDQEMLEALPTILTSFRWEN